jgi:hypothetical protein
MSGLPIPSCTSQSFLKPLDELEYTQLLIDHLDREGVGYEFKQCDFSRDHMNRHRCCAQLFSRYLPITLFFPDANCKPTVKGELCGTSMPFQSFQNAKNDVAREVLEFKYKFNLWGIL